LSRLVKHARIPHHTNQNPRPPHNSSNPPGHYKDGDGLSWVATTFARGNKFIVVEFEYFTRWIEAKPLATNHFRNSEKVLSAKHNL
jgi:hypothetical protein